MFKLCKIYFYFLSYTSATLSLLKREAITTDNKRNIISIVKHAFLSEQHTCRFNWNNLYKINIDQSGQQ